MLLAVHMPDPTKSRGQYMDLLELSVKEDPRCPRNAFYYARELSFNERWEQAIEAIEISNSNSELDKYIKAASNKNGDIKIVKTFPAIPSGSIRVSSDYIYPRVYLNLIAYIFIAIFIGLFLDWIYLRLHAVMRG